MATSALDEQDQSIQNISTSELIDIAEMRTATLAPQKINQSG